MLPHIMRVCRSVLLLLVLVSTSLAAEEVNGAACPRTPVLGDSPRRQLWLRGEIGDYLTRMYLEQGGPTIIGVYYYTADVPWRPVVLGGSLNGDALEASDQADETPAAGQLTGNLTSTGFVGAWTPKGSVHLPARLRFEAAPSCKGSGPWKRLNDPTLPITFSYPASWQLSRSTYGITLACPDPAKMAYEDNGVHIRTGALRDVGDRGFHFTNGRWTYDYTAGCDVENDDPHGCADAPVTHRGPITILNGDNREWRMYCAHDGGYIGSGDGNLRLLIVGERWVELSGVVDDAQMVLRIVATARPRVAPTDRLNPRLNETSDARQQ